MMDEKTIKNIFNFLEKNDNIKAPFLWKLENNIPLSKEELNFKGNLNLELKNITSLPEGLKVEGNLFLNDCKNLTSLPEGLKVGENLLLNNCTNLTLLPEGLQVGGYLDLQNCTGLTLLPEGMEVGENLYIRKTLLKNYSDEELREMIKPGFIGGKIL